MGQSVLKLLKILILNIVLWHSGHCHSDPNFGSELGLRTRLNQIKKKFEVQNATVFVSFGELQSFQWAGE